MVSGKGAAAFAVNFMQTVSTRLQVRPVENDDYHQLVNFIHFESYVHRHLDWLAPLDWMKIPPFWVATHGQRVVGVLSSPVAPPGIAWIRLFGVDSEWNVQHVWQALWGEAIKDFQKIPKPVIAALPLHNWFSEILLSAGFQEATKVVFLTWQKGHKHLPEVNSPVRIRPMVFDDLEQVVDVDNTAFKPIWANELQMLTAAYHQSAVSSVAQDTNGRIVGYQISTSGHLGGHLARLAVLPEEQGKRIGAALVVDMLNQFISRDVYRISVNTQQDNAVSLKLYTRLGFQFSGETYPVYKFEN